MIGKRMTLSGGRNTERLEDWINWNGIKSKRQRSDLHVMRCRFFGGILPWFLDTMRDRLLLFYSLFSYSPVGMTSELCDPGLPCLGFHKSLTSSSIAVCYNSLFSLNEDCQKDFALSFRIQVMKSEKGSLCQSPTDFRRLENQWNSRRGKCSFRLCSSLSLSCRERVGSR